MHANHLQAFAIRRYHKHLQRVGRNLTLESASREWIGRYARLWRQRYEARRTLLAA
jgi:hypothetical protein